MTPASSRTKMIAPRLASGARRETFGHGLPPEIKAGLRAIAAREHKSMSWVLEEVIIDYFSLRRPRYLGEEKPIRLVHRRRA